MFRKVIAIVVGLIAGGVVVAAVETICSVLHSLPPGVDPSDSEQFKAYVATLPPLAFILILVAHSAGCFASGVVCSLIARPWWHTGATLLGLFFLAAGILNLLLIPHPVWFAVADAAVYVPSALAGSAVVAFFRSPRS